MSGVRVLRIAGCLLPCACVVVTALPPEAVCEEVATAYASRIYTCAGEAEVARERADAFEQAHSCRVTGFADEEEFVLGEEWDSSFERYLLLEGDESITLPDAWTCVTVVSDLDCATALSIVPASRWPEALSPACGALFEPKANAPAWAPPGESSDTGTP